MKMIRILILVALLTQAHTVYSQTNQENDGKKFDYSFAFGVRAGGTSGVTFKHMMNRGSAVEFILGVWPSAVGFTALYEKHVQSSFNGLRFYYGGGLHATAEANRQLYRDFNNTSGERIYRYGPDGYGIGIDGMVGLEYKIPVIPVAISFDLKPLVEVSNLGTVFTAIDPGLGIKFAF
jgi:hypothetical protein